MQTMLQQWCLGSVPISILSFNKRFILVSWFMYGPLMTPSCQMESNSLLCIEWYHAWSPATITFFLFYHISREILFLGKSYFLGNTISGEILFWGNPISGEILFLGKSFSGEILFWGGILSYCNDNTVTRRCAYCKQCCRVGVVGGR